RAMNASRSVVFAAGAWPADGTETPVMASITSAGTNERTGILPMDARRGQCRMTNAECRKYGAFGIRHSAFTWAGTRYDEARPCGVPAHRLQFCAGHRPPRGGFHALPRVDCDHLRRRAPVCQRPRRRGAGRLLR